jgi:hypothetical protein
MKPIIVTAKRVKNGYLISNSPELDVLNAEEIIVEIIAEESDSAPEKNSELKNKSGLKKRAGC